MPTRHAREALRILVALDGSDHARIALDVVACLPLTPADLVILLSVAEIDPATAHWVRRRQNEDLDVLLRAAWAAERAAAGSAVDAASSALGTWETPVRQVVRSGPAVDVIAATTTELAADLLVVGPRGRGLLGDLLLGSVAHALLRRVPCPVLVGRNPVGAPERVVLAVNGSPHDRETARRLTEYPLAARALVTVATVAPTPDVGATATARAHAIAAAAVLEAAGVASETEVPVGDPGGEVVALARRVGAGLVVVGSRGLGGSRSFLLGSVSHHVVGHAPCSVLVVPPAATRRADA